MKSQEGWLFDDLTFSKVGGTWGPHLMHPFKVEEVYTELAKVEVSDINILLAAYSLIMLDYRVKNALWVAAQNAQAVAFLENVQLKTTMIIKSFKIKNAN